MRLAGPVLFAVVLFACTPSGASLEVQLVTDYAPIRDFDTITVTLDGGETRSVPATMGHGYGRPTRIARFDGLPSVRTGFTVALESGGHVVQSQPRSVDLGPSLTIHTAHITKDCMGVTCPGAAGPRAIACLGGQCVDPMCSAEHPELCPSACASGCGAPPFPCVDRVCADEGVCVDLPDDTRCGTGEICVTDLGCHVPYSAPEDAGVGDAGSGDTGADAAVVVSIETFVEGLGQEVCTALSICLGPQSDDVPVADCAHEFGAVFTGSLLPRMREAIAAGTMRYDGSFVTACLAVLDREPCQSITWGYPTVCENVMTGMVPVGGACNDSFECMGDAYCRTDGDLTCPLGTCQPRSDVAGACVATATESADQRCMRGLRCVSGACAMPVAMGQPCPTGTECASGAFCMGTPTRVCVDQATAYAGTETSSCNASAGPFCQPGLSCSGDSCVRAVASGTACMPAVPDVCPTGEYCDGTSMLCTALPGDASHCLDASHPVRCLPGLFCGPDGFCRDLRPNGTECDAASECASTVCSTTCQPPTLCPF